IILILFLPDSSGVQLLRIHEHRLFRGIEHPALHLLVEETYAAVRRRTSGEVAGMEPVADIIRRDIELHRIIHRILLLIIFGLVKRRGMILIPRQYPEYSGRGFKTGPSG